MELKFAAIDIGSNAVRLLLAKVFENNGSPFIKKESLIRMPVRLGDGLIHIMYEKYKLGQEKRRIKFENINIFM